MATMSEAAECCWCNQDEAAAHSILKAVAGNVAGQVNVDDCLRVSSL